MYLKVAWGRCHNLSQYSPLWVSRGTLKITFPKTWWFYPHSFFFLIQGHKEEVQCQKRCCVQSLGMLCRSRASRSWDRQGRHHPRLMMSSLGSTSSALSLSDSAECSRRHINTHKPRHTHTCLWHSECVTQVKKLVMSERAAFSWLAQIATALGSHAVMLSSGKWTDRGEQADILELFNPFAIRI